MIRLLSATFCVVITVSSATDVFIIDTKPDERSPQGSLFVDKLRLLQNLLGTQNRPSASNSKLLNLIKPRNRNTYEKRSYDYRLFRNMYGIYPKKLKTLVFKKAPTPYEHDENDPFIKFLLTTKIPQLNQLEDGSRPRDEHNSHDYIDIADVGRVKPSFSEDYIDFRNIRRRNKKHKEVKPEKRSYSVESDREDSSEAHKLKRFEIIKNKHNKKDIKTSDSEEMKYKKTKAKFKKRKAYLPVLSSKKKKYSSEERPLNKLSKEAEKHSSKSSEYASKKSKKKHKKKKYESAENDEWNENKQPIELYLQGNKLVMYPPMDPDSSGEASDNTRRMRLPYFLPKRYNWHPDDIHELGYFFFNGPKGFSNER